MYPSRCTLAPCQLVHTVRGMLDANFFLGISATAPCSIQEVGAVAIMHQVTVDHSVAQQ